MSSRLLRRRLDGGLLSRLLDDPELAPTLRALPAPVLRQVILRVGLEDAGELVTLASLEQLREVFDEDLWRSAQPGQDEAFDAERFSVWLEVLLEGGEALVADRLAELSEDFLVFAVAQLVRVLDVNVLTTWAADPGEAELLDRIVDAQLGQELDDYLVLSRREWGWDAVLTTLLALDERHPQLLRAVSSRCAQAAHEEVGSAHELRAALSGEELLLEAGVEPDAAAAPAAAGTRFRQALAELFESDPAAHQRAVEELAFLANVLLAGDSSAGAGLRPVAAAERVLELCDEGLRSITDRDGPGPRAPGEALWRWGAVGAFRFAWAARHGSA